MIRRIARLAFVTAGVAILVSAKAVHGSDKDNAKSPAPFVHVVIVPLKSDAPAGTADEIITDSHEMLAKIPTVRELAAGKPAPKTGFAKTDYQVGLVLRFDNFEDLLAYEKHPLHQDFLKKHAKNVQLNKLAIFDFIDQKK
jgi:hypothetical protein